MFIPYSCSYIENGTIKYIFAWMPTELNEAPTTQYFNGWIINSNNVYSKTGNTALGIPAVTDTNFYSVFGS